MEQELKSKHFLQSHTIKGAILNIISILVILVAMHNKLDPTADAAFVSALLSNVLVIYGRWRAKEPLTFKREKKDVQKSS